MNILPYTEEQRIFRDAVRKFFAKEVIPHAEEWEETGMLPRSVWKKMGDNGFLCMQAPEEYGGLESDFLYSLIIMEELASSNHFGLLSSLHRDQRTHENHCRQIYGPLAQASVSVNPFTIHAVMQENGKTPEANHHSRHKEV